MNSPVSSLFAPSPTRAYIFCSSLWWVAGQVSMKCTLWISFFFFVVISLLSLVLNREHGHHPEHLILTSLLMGVWFGKTGYDYQVFFFWTHKCYINIWNITKFTSRIQYAAYSKCSSQVAGELFKTKSEVQTHFSSLEIVNVTNHEITTLTRRLTMYTWQSILESGDSWSVLRSWTCPERHKKDLYKLFWNPLDLFVLESLGLDTDSPVNRHL